MIAQAQKQPIDLLQGCKCCACNMRPGLKRFHRLRGETGSAFRLVKVFCTVCGFVPSFGLHLHRDDLTESAILAAGIDNAHAAVTAKTVTTATISRMPHPVDFVHLGLVKNVSASARIAGYPIDRQTLEPLLMAELGLTVQRPFRPLAAPLFNDIQANVFLTVGHIFQPDASTGRANRIDDNHISYWPLIPLTLQEPYEVWHQQMPGRQNTKVWAFFGCYLIGGEFVYHMVLVDRRRIVLTSYRLNGAAQAHNKRSGLPIFVAY